MMKKHDEPMMGSRCLFWLTSKSYLIFDFNR